MSEVQPLKYLCYDNKNFRDHIINVCDNSEIKNHILDLYNLIEYQMKTIHEQRLKIVAIEHQYGWKQYNKSKEI